MMHESTNIWYNHSVLVAVRYAGQDGTDQKLCVNLVIY